MKTQLAQQSQQLLAYPRCPQYFHFLCALLPNAQPREPGILLRRFLDGSFVKLLPLPTLVNAHVCLLLTRKDRAGEIAFVVSFALMRVFGLRSFLSARPTASRCSCVCRPICAPRRFRILCSNLR